MGSRFILWIIGHSHVYWARKLVEECKRLQSEIIQLSDENQVLKDESIKIRKVVTEKSSKAMLRDQGNPIPSLVVIAAIFIGFFLGKFIL
ncbi:vesicle-associated membrane protein-associated protein A-like [Spea bombifrons]|uniref:vesicle-associated membrane protein-associated protein A-like n=1 Tax=Spea bombifrons TaxID=233779 RepID=UPI0023490813|nr:vesicle-associated membrane protein-associated protein A-like [Spea bombifrons]